MPQKRSTQQNYFYLAIVSIVAVVAVIILVLNFGGSKEAVVGESFRLPVISAQTSTGSTASRLLIGTYHELGTDLGTFMVRADRGSWEYFGDQSLRSVSTLSSGGTITLVDTLYQAYAGGLGGTHFLLDGACNNKLYDIEAYAVNNAPLDPTGQFNINGERFRMELGDSYTLRDGTDVFLFDATMPIYSGRLRSGPTFELSNC